MRASRTVPGLVRGVLAIAAAAAAPIGAVAASGTTEPSDPVPASSVAAERGPQPPDDPDRYIDVLLGLVPEGEVQGFYIELEQQREADTAACMERRGLEYHPEDTPPVAAEDPAFGTPEYAQQYGFGNWTLMDQALQEVEPEGTLPVSANEELLGGLPPEEIDPWFAALAECQEEVTIASDIFANPDVARIVADVQGQAAADPRLADADAAWAACMAEAGFDYADQEAMYEDVNAGDDDGSLHNKLFESKAWDPASPDHGEWQALVDHEIEVAVANAGCQPAHEEARRAIYADYRDELAAAWETIDWDQPPVTFGGTDVTLEPLDTVAPDTGPAASGPVDSTEPPG